METEAETKLLYELDAHKWVFDATVVKTFPCDRWTAIILDQTGCFPGLPGHQQDRAWLNNQRVSGIYYRYGQIIHLVDKPIQVGARVQGIIDMEYRLPYMRYHSCEHLIMGVVTQRYDGRLVRWNYDLDGVTVDFKCADFNHKRMKAVEKDVNLLIQDKIGVLSYHEFVQPEPQVRVQPGNPPRLGDWGRMIEIPGVDLTVCKGLHCESTNWIGSLELDEFDEVYEDGDRHWRMWFTLQQAHYQS